MKYTKYPRTYHLPFSQGRTSDDKTLKDCSIFNNKEIIVTIKMDGENTSCYQDGNIHARSIDSQNHESRNWIKNSLQSILYLIPENWRICGENLFAKHSIHYINLKSYFYLFSVWDNKNNCLDWADTTEWANLLELHTVDEIYRGDFSQELIMERYKEYLKSYPDTEGFVVRNINSFTYSEFSKNVAKFVRASHIQTNKHWSKEKIIQNELMF